VETVCVREQQNSNSKRWSASGRGGGRSTAMVRKGAEGVSDWKGRESHHSLKHSMKRGTSPKKQTSCHYWNIRRITGKLEGSTEGKRISKRGNGLDWRGNHSLSGKTENGFRLWQWFTSEQNRDKDDSGNLGKRRQTASMKGLGKSASRTRSGETFRKRGRVHCECGNEKTTRK